MFEVKELPTGNYYAKLYNTPRNEMLLKNFIQHKVLWRDREAICVRVDKENLTKIRVLGRV